jgi:tripartite-type tricarboxylate transporter receptor subunit TctC
VPTFAEEGVPNQESAFLVGIVAPAGTPADIVNRLNRELRRILAEPDVKARLTSIGYVAETDSPAEFAALIKSEIALWARVIRDAKLKKIE